MQHKHKNCYINALKNKHMLTLTTTRHNTLCHTSYHHTTKQRPSQHQHTVERVVHVVQCCVYVRVLSLCVWASYSYTRQVQARILTRNNTHTRTTTDQQCASVLKCVSGICVLQYVFLVVIYIAIACAQHDLTAFVRMSWYKPTDIRIATVRQASGQQRRQTTAHTCGARVQCGFMLYMRVAPLQRSTLISVRAQAQLALAPAPSASNRREPYAASVMVCQCVLVLYQLIIGVLQL